MRAWCWKGDGLSPSSGLRVLDALAVSAALAEGQRMRADAAELTAMRAMALLSEWRAWVRDFGARVDAVLVGRP